jgi:hypothetical protein
LGNPQNRVQTLLLGASADVRTARLRASARTYQVFHPEDDGDLGGGLPGVESGLLILGGAPAILTLSCSQLVCDVHASVALEVWIGNVGDQFLG